MTKWVWKGLTTGIKTTAYPRSQETAPGVSPGRPRTTEVGIRNDRKSLLTLCPTKALFIANEARRVDYSRCIHCFRCNRWGHDGLEWEEGYEWAEMASGAKPLEVPFSHSLHIRIVDAGACGGCLSEIKQITSPYYNIHRLGFFITPTPRAADLLLVAGPLTDPMRLPLKKAYEAMPSPNRVIAVGTCALSGGVFGPSFATAASVSEAVPVDIGVPGCPPPPLAILHALLLVSGRKKPINIASPIGTITKGDL